MKENWRNADKPKVPCFYLGPPNGTHTHAHHFEGRVVPDDVTYMSTKPGKCMAAVTQNETLANINKKWKYQDIET